MKCLITGGCGFLGSHLAEKLVKLGHKVTIIDDLSSGNVNNIKHIKDNVKLIKGNIVNKKIFKHFKNIDWIFHLAAKADIVPSIEEPRGYFDTNVMGTLNVIEGCRNIKIKKFIYIASSTCYGIPKRYPTNESSKIITKFPYALTKYFGEQLVLHWGEIYRIPVVSLRCFNIYGTRSRTSGAYGAVIGVFLAQKLKNKPLTIVGDGKQKRDFTFVKDVVDAIIKTAKSKKINKIYNVGSERAVSINHLSKLIGGKKTFIPKRPGEPDKTFADISKIKKDIKWKPKTSIETGMRIVLENIHFWNTAPVWTKKKIKKVTQKWFKYLGKR